MENFAHNVAKNVGFDPTIIISIIAAIMEMLGGCAMKPKPKDVISSGGFRGRLLIARSLLRNKIRPNSDEGQKITEAIVSEAKSVSEAEAVLFLNDCYAA